MKSFAAILLLALASSAHASNASANQGHHGGSMGAVGASAGAFGGSTTGASAGSNASQSGSGGRYSIVDNYQPWPESEMASFQKPHWTPYQGD
jgi:hypothetical protein